jgi:hypothetical protein
LEPLKIKDKKPSSDLSLFQINTRQEMPVLCGIWTDCANEFGREETQN